MNGLPTPKTLDEAIIHALCVGPLTEVKERIYQHIEDFLSQKFGVAYIEAGSDKQMLQILEKLFAECRRRAK